MEAWIYWLESKEALINAIVGILTLAAAGWGVFKLSMLRLQNQTERHETNNQRVSIPPHGDPEPERLGLRRFLVDLGLDSGSDIEERVSIRTVNVCLFAVILIGFSWVVVSLFSPDLLMLTLLNGALFLLALLALAFQSSGYTSLARWILLLIAGVYFPTIMVVLGKYRGVEYFFCLIIIIPVLIFSSRELVQRYLTIIAFVGIFALGVFLQSVVTPMALSPDIFTFGYYANVILLTLCIFMTINFYNNFSIDSFHDLEVEKAKTDELVRNILPDYVANKIRENGATIASSHSEAAVLFSTIDGFHNLYKRVSAIQLVEFLSGIFDEFDELVRFHGIEKVNTLGTNYVVATGIAGTTIANHTAIAAFALDAMRVVKQASERLNHGFSYRAGVSTGNVVSGVIGHEKPSFDIWGETVELANSMRYTAIGNSIVVNEAAYWRLKDEFEFAVTGGDKHAYILLKALV